MSKTYDIRSEDFPYLDKDSIYLDSACQSLRPQPVIDALNNYYTQYNSCGERVKYKWGQVVDDKVAKTRTAVLKYLKLRDKDYFVSFTLNTTYGINLILDQIETDSIDKIMTSDIEHNSPFLASTSFSRRHNIPREVMRRDDDGTIDVAEYDFTGALVVLNTVSNIDGRRLENVNQLIKTVHDAGGIVILDAAQGMTFGKDLLTKTQADAICFSSHKMYGPSLGIMVVRRDLLPRINSTFIGGGMVDDVDGTESYVLSADSPNHAYTKFEPGLQAWGEIIAFGVAIEWLNRIEAHSQIDYLAQKLYDFLENSPKIHLINQKPSPVMSFYHETLDADTLAEALSDNGIMARSGYFCCHYYLGQVKDYPPMLRLSLGLHNNEADVDKLISSLERVAK